MNMIAAALNGEKTQRIAEAIIKALDDMPETADCTDIIGALVYLLGDAMAQMAVAAAFDDHVLPHLFAQVGDLLGSAAHFSLEKKRETAPEWTKHTGAPQ